MYIAADSWSHRNTVFATFSVLLYSTFIVQILYKLYTPQLNCTYSNHTQPAATQHHTTSPADPFCSPVQPAVSHYPVSVRIHSVMSIDRTVQITTPPHSTVPPAHSTTKHTQLSLCSVLQPHLYRQSHTESRSFKFTLLATSAVSQFDSDKEQLAGTD
jgi:hypothetical protein